MKNRIGMAIAVAAVALSLGGCATQEDVVAVPYAAKGGAVIGSQLPVLVLVEDARTEDRTRISNKINGYGMEMAAIRANRAVADIVKDAMEAELRSRGFMVGDGGSQAKIAITRFYTAFIQGLWSGKARGEVKMRVVVASALGRNLYERLVDVEGDVGSVQLASGSNAAAALSDGMARAFTTLFDDPAFVAALKVSAATASLSLVPNS